MFTSAFKELDLVPHLKPRPSWANSWNPGSHYHFPLAQDAARLRSRLSFQTEFLLLALA
jgi:hypothetical protein